MQTFKTSLNWRASKSSTKDFEYQFGSRWCWSQETPWETHHSKSPVGLCWISVTVHSSTLSQCFCSQAEREMYDRAFTNRYKVTECRWIYSRSLLKKYYTTSHPQLKVKWDEMICWFWCNISWNLFTLFFIVLNILKVSRMNGFQKIFASK